MNTANRHELWNAYFEADFRYRYFLSLKDHLANWITRLGVAIALLSCGPLVDFWWQLGFGGVVSALTGTVAGLLGVYLGVSGITRKLATATRAATEWGSASRLLRQLWTRHECGEDVWSEFFQLEGRLSSIDAAAIEDLQRHRKLEDQAWKESSTALTA